MMPKWIQKSIKKMMDFGIAPGRALGRQKGPTAPLNWTVQGPRGGLPLIVGRTPPGLVGRRLRSAAPGLS